MIISILIPPCPCPYGIFLPSKAKPSIPYTLAYEPAAAAEPTRAPGMRPLFSPTMPPSSNALPATSCGPYCPRRSYRTNPSRKMCRAWFPTDRMRDSTVNEAAPVFSSTWARVALVAETAVERQSYRGSPERPVKEGRVGSSDGNSKDGPTSLVCV